MGRECVFRVVSFEHFPGETPGPPNYPEGHAIPPCESYLNSTILTIVFTPSWGSQLEPDYRLKSDWGNLCKRLCFLKLFFG